jgi:hypothetical protein
MRNLSKARSRWPARITLQQIAKREYAHGHREKTEHLAERDLLVQLSEDGKKWNRQTDELEHSRDSVHESTVTLARAAGKAATWQRRWRFDTMSA